jgi:hypothetical protein
VDVATIDVKESGTPAAKQTIQDLNVAIQQPPSMVAKQEEETLAANDEIF